VRDARAVASVDDPFELIARLACPACSFPIGLRRSDSVGDHVHCPVCGASALVSARTSTAGPFRAVEPLALVPHEELVVEVRAPASPWWRWGAQLVIAAVAVAVATFHLPGLIVLGLGAWGLSSVSVQLGERGRARGGELVHTRALPWPRTARVSLAGASIDVEPTRVAWHFVVVVTQRDARIVIGDTCPLTREQAEAIARRLRDRAASVERLALEDPR
jgi:DNA-directed RNA polymerase subunit RPC12/RpoP